MRVIAIDPGYDRVGVAVVERTSNQTDTVLFSTCITTDATQNLTDRIHTIGKELHTIFDTYNPTAMAIETLFFNKNVKTAIGVAHARGVILYIAKQYDCEIFEFGPQQIKVAVTGYGKSDKVAVTAMLRKIVHNIPTTGMDDEYDAIAVGITCLAHYRMSI